MIIRIDDNDFDKVKKYLMSSDVQYTYPNANEAAANIIVKDAIETYKEQHNINDVCDDIKFEKTLIEFVKNDLFDSPIPDSFKNLMCKFDGFKNLYKKLANNN